MKNNNDFIIEKVLINYCLEKYRENRLIGCSDKFPKIDDNYKIEINSDSFLNNTNNFIKKEIKEFVIAYNKLPLIQRMIFYYNYICDINYDNGFIANKLGYSTGYYHELKKNTLRNFALAIGIKCVC